MLQILFHQIIIMALLAAAGYYFSKRGMLSETTSKDLGSLLVKFVIPCVIVRSYLTDFSKERLYYLGIAALLSLFSFLLTMALSYAIYGKRRPVENFAAVFGNAGFIGIPIVQALTGSDGVFYIAVYVALLNFFQWTYGVYVITDRKETISVKTVAKNPVLIGLLLGMVLFLLRISVPQIVTDTLGYITDLNTPIAMLLLGSYLVKVKPRQMFCSLSAYGCVFVRLVLFPLLVLFLLRLLPLENMDLKLAIFLVAAMPVGSNICIFTQIYEGDYQLSVVTVCLSTVLSIVTLPCMAALAQAVL